MYNKPMKKGQKKKHRGLRLFVKFQIFLMILILGAVAYYYLSGYGAVVSELKDEASRYVAKSTPETFKSTETSIAYDVNDQVISIMRGEKDVYYVESQRIPTYCKQAIISIEDKKFYKHHGIDYRAIIRAGLAILRDGKVSQGGSTITQQLARTIFLNQDKTWQRKVEEIYIALALEEKYSKDQILEFYLNNIYFANGYYGIEAASKGYFNKNVNQLSLSEITFLCAIPNNPNNYDPYQHFDHTGICWSSLGGLKGVKPPEAFGERPRDWSLGHAGDEGPHLSMTGESRGCSRAAAPVCGFSRPLKGMRS